MAWSKTKQQLESFLSPTLIGRVEYRASGYRYAVDKIGLCYITVDKREIFRMDDPAPIIRWYHSDQEVKNDPAIVTSVTAEELDAVRTEANGSIPEERLEIIVRNRKLTSCAKKIYSAQTTLSKSDFMATANSFLSASIEECLESDMLLLNVFALVDRRMGKKRLLAMEQKIKQSHPIVQYFYQLRCSTL